MNKKVRKALSLIFPKGTLKERIKLRIYNSTSKIAKFGIEGDTFKTRFGDEFYLTTSPLYRVVEDFNFYTHFYRPKPSDVVIDAGANQGFVSLYLASLLKGEGTVWAFEPDSINIKTIARNKDLNPAFAANIEVVDLLLWDKNEMVEFYEAGTVGSSAHYVPDKEKTVMKRAITLDTWVAENNIDRLDFIKMDIEGAELEAVEGAINTIKRFSPNFAIASYHIINGEPTYIKLEAFFKRIGYPCKTIRFNKNEIITFAGPKVL